MRRELAAEFLGTSALLMIVVGSGIMADQVFARSASQPGMMTYPTIEIGLSLLANSMATGAGLYVLIQSLAPISGAHFNPLVSLLALANKQLSAAQSLAYMTAQFSGALMGVALTHLMFSRPVFELASKTRTGPALWISECIASIGLLAVIALNKQKSLAAQAAGVALWITAAYWFTSSTSFANPAVTLARSLTASFTGIAPADVLGFCLAQIAGFFVVILFSKLLVPAKLSAT